MFNLFFLQLSKLSSTWSVKFPNLPDLRDDCITVNIPFETIFFVPQRKECLLFTSSARLKKVSLVVATISCQTNTEVYHNTSHLGLLYDVNDNQLKRLNVKFLIPNSFWTNDRANFGEPLQLKFWKLEWLDIELCKVISGKDFIKYHNHLSNLGLLLDKITEHGQYFNCRLNKGQSYRISSQRFLL